MKERVLIVDDIASNIQILFELLKDNYNVSTSNNGKRALKLAADAANRPDIILLDVMMPDMDGFEVCRKLKENPSTRDIPVIFVTALEDTINEKHGLELGVVDYITKPINPPILLNRIKNQLELKKHRDKLEELVRERTAEIVETRLEIIRKLGKAAEYKDNETGLHVIRMSKFSYLIALKYGLSEEKAELLLNTAPMHDIGKIGIPDNILLKPGKLDPGEWKVMKDHAFIGSSIIDDNKSELLSTARIIALQHHEKWDGSGYPEGLKGEEINVYARIVAIADVFDALTSKRPYKEPWSIEKSVDLIKSEKGTHFDPGVVDAFLECLDEIIEIKEKYSEK